MLFKHRAYTTLAASDDEKHHTTLNSQLPFSLTNKSLIFFLAISSMGHILWLVILTSYLLSELAKPCGHEKSPHVGLTNDVPLPFWDITIFIHRNSVVAEMTWDSWTIEPGIVTLPRLSSQIVNRSVFLPPWLRWFIIPFQNVDCIPRGHHSLCHHISIAVITLRFYTRSKKNANVRFDDWIQVSTLVCFAT